MKLIGFNKLMQAISQLPESSTIDPSLPAIAVSVNTQTGEVLFQHICWHQIDELYIKNERVSAGDLLPVGCIRFRSKRPDVHEWVSDRADGFTAYQDMN